MTEQRTSLHGHWSSRLAFILAVAGSAVGLGNIWRFPYMAGENGGGAFVLIYLVCVVVVGLPIMMSEILLGRRGRRNPVATMRLLGEEETGTIKWRWVGILGVATGFLILSFYSVIAGWAVAYIFEGGSGVFNGADLGTVGATFEALTTNPVRTGLWHTFFMGITIFVVALGVEEGLERAVRVLMPALILLLLVLLVYGILQGSFAAGVDFLLKPKFEELTAGAWIAALGQAFFTLSVGMGAIMAYGAYLPNEESIIRTSVAVVIADTGIAILAGLVIFPIVFQFDVPVDQGPGLVFVSLPLAFGQMTGGVYVAVCFFVLLTFAAWTSAISLMEPAVAWVVESFGLSRQSAAVRVGLIIWALGFLTVLSFSHLADFKFGRGTFFDNLDFLAVNIMLPLGGLLLTVFAGWVMCQNSSADELDPGVGPVYRLWRLLARFVAPVAVLLVLMNAFGLFD
ncbi:MAG TPA: sodium-dependent transporter [Gammaproteobacteria bacterium]